MTNPEIVKKIILLRRWDGKILLPTSELFDFGEYFNRFVKCPSFFDYPAEYKFSSIVGLLPPMSNKRIVISDKLNGFDKNTNLYIFYIDKCLDHLGEFGELVFCTPSDFFKNAPLLNRKLYNMGTITDVICTNRGGQIIWRFVKDDFSRKALVNGVWKNFTSINDQLLFLNEEYTVPFTDLFSIHVGAISGLDEAFINNKGNVDFITSQTPHNGSTKRMFFNSFDESILKYKKKLLARRIKKFSEDNWWTWVRSHYVSDSPRVYVPCKTCQPFPFFHHESIHYDGTILAIFFKVKIKPAKVVNLLNKVDWDELGFRVGKRLIFNQKSLEGIRLPKDFLLVNP